MDKKQAEKIMVDIASIVNDMGDDNWKEQYIDTLFSECLEIYTDNDSSKSELIFMGEKIKISIKTENFVLNFRKLLDFSAGLIFTGSLPDSKLKTIGLTVYILTKIIDASKLILTDSMAEIICFLYDKNAFYCPIEEEFCKKFFENKASSNYTYKETMDALEKIKVIEINDGNIRLMEKVVYIL